MNQPIKYYILLIILSPFSFCISAQTPQKASKRLSIEQYINIYKNIAIREMESHGIPASITLAQGIHESGSGNSRLAKEANNHFGIKCANWKGKKIYKWDDEAVESCFRAYKNAEESFIDHSKILTTRKRYSFLFDYDKTQYKKWAKGLRKAGYATDPRYPEKLITTIERYDLAQYDLAISNIVVTKDEPKYQAIIGDPTDIYITPEEINRSLRKKPRSFLFLYYKKGLYRQNGSTYAVAKQGETALQIATRFGIPYKKFLLFNDLVDGDELIDYQYCYIQPKKIKYREAGNAYHRVTDDVTMYELAQYYGLRLVTLYQRNMLSPGQEPRNGELIMLNEQVSFPPKIRLSSGADDLPVDSTITVDPVVPEFPIELDTYRVAPVPEPPLKVNQPIFPPNYYNNTGNSINTTTTTDNRNFEIDINAEDPDWLKELEKDTISKVNKNPKSTIIPIDSSINTSNSQLNDNPFGNKNKSNSQLNDNPLKKNHKGSNNQLSDNPFGNTLTKITSLSPLPNNDQYFIYHVKAKETLYGIGKKFKVSWQTIKTFNRLKNTVIKEKQVLKIPKK